MAEFGDVFGVVTFIPMHAYEHKSTKIPMHGALSIWMRVWFRADSQILQYIMWGQCLVNIHWKRYNTINGLKP